MSESIVIKRKFEIPERYKDVQFSDVPKIIQENIQKIGETRKGMFLHGGVGTGKTHIAYAIGKYVYEELGKSVVVWNSAELMNRIRESYNNKHDDFVDDLVRYRGLLIVDDIGAEKLSEWVGEQFYLIVNRKYNDLLPVIFTSNFNVSELSERIGDRVASRITEMCEVVELGGSDRRLI